MGFTAVGLCIHAATGCTQYRWESPADFAAAVHRSESVVRRLDQMPTDDLGKLAFSKRLQKEWSALEERVFAGTPYLGARVRHSPPGLDTTSKKLSPRTGSFATVGEGRPAFQGRLGNGKARTPEYTGRIYVYRVQDGWTELTVYIAASGRPVQTD